jgi:hypothetical protein
MSFGTFMGFAPAEHIDRGDPGGCWPWMRSVGSHGYGQLRWDGTTRLIHRVVWEHVNGTIPKGLTVDHICHNRRCCNPDHLRLLTNLDNASDNGFATRTHCPQGHPYDEANTGRYMDKRYGRRHRTCLTCARERMRARV